MLLSQPLDRQTLDMTNLRQNKCYVISHACYVYGLFCPRVCYNINLYIQVYLSWYNQIQSNPCFRTYTQCHSDIFHPIPQPVNLWSAHQYDVQGSWGLLVEWYEQWCELSGWLVPAAQWQSCLSCNNSPTVWAEETDLQWSRYHVISA